MGRGGTPVGAYRLRRELKPLCKECKREEIDGGDLCHGCRARLAYQKKAAAEKLKACHEIAERLYKIDREKYAEIFAFINKMVKRGRSLLLILHAIEALERQIKLGSPPRGIGCFDYLSGTLRRLEEKSEAEKLRQRGPMKLGDIPLNLKDLANMGEKK